MRSLFSIGAFALVVVLSDHAHAQFSTVRLAVVPSPDETGLLRELLPDFERESGYRVTVYAGEDLYNVARAGQADLVISHYGHTGTEAFMTQGLGLSPRTLFGNQIAIIGPAADPAQIRGLQDGAEAVRRISRNSGSRFVSNNSAIMKYNESVLWQLAGRPAPGAWYVDTGASEDEGLLVAARLGAYYIFALPPFIRWQAECVRLGGGSLCNMEPLLLAGPMPHRIMVSMVANPQRFAAINVAGATALQAYLLRPAVQARIENFRMPGISYQVWRAAGLHNSGAALGLGRRQ